MIGHLYYEIYLYTAIVLTLICAIYNFNRSFNQISIGSTSQNGLTILVSVCLIFFLGARELSYAFGDTGNYVFIYNSVSAGHMSIGEQDPLWGELILWCLPYFEARGYIRLIAALYIGFTALACIKLFPRNSFIAFLFNIGAFSFYTYGVNGIRNGMACAIVLLAIALMTGNVKEKICGIILGIIATGFHKSTTLPVVTAIVALIGIKNFSTALKFWVLSIGLSLIAGNWFSEFFATLGFDDRLDYLQEEMEQGTFSRTGFRWDFLIYSAMPILLGYYIIIKRGIRNATYEFILNTYVLANAFWILVIRANYSNRFAYLSWFLYPMVLAFPLLKVDVWEELQGKRLAQIITAQVAFTWFMSTLY